MKLLIDTEWAAFIEDLPVEKQLEFFWAVFDFGNRPCSLKCWSKIEPVLEKGRVGYYNKLRSLKQFANTAPVSVSVSDSVSGPDTVPVPGSVSNITNSRIINNNISTTRARAKQSAFVPPTLDEVLAYATDQSACAGCGGFACDQRTAEEFWSYYSGLGWVLPNDAQTPIRDWKPFLRKWARSPNRFRFASNAPDPDDLPI